MKRALVAGALFAILPAAAQAQSLQYPGFYIGAEGGANWLLNTSSSTTATAFTPFGAFSQTGTTNLNFNTGWVVGGMIGYDLLGPRFEVEGVYRQNNGNVTIPGLAGSSGITASNVGVMANAYYDFLAGQTIVPYIGAGLGVAFTQLSLSGAGNSNSTQFAYQGIVGVGWNINPMFRLNLEGRYYGTTSPYYSFSSATNVAGFTIPVTANGSYNDNNFSVMASLHVRFGAPAEAPPPPPPTTVAPPSFMVFFDWDRSNLSQQALATIQQAADAFRQKGNARITATGHTDTSGPESYNMALSLRRANAVKDALVRDGVPAQAITVIGMGEKGLLVPTGDGVREPQNRRVEIVIQ
ncbi:MAG: OmpA family protein [Alphaproteobacteria bacterium]|nr:OmpA family protein [Alphaproteobacteria bacterium]